MLSEVIVKYCSRTMSAPPYYVDWHLHKYWEMVYYTGLGVSTVGELPFNYIERSYVVIPPGAPHREKALAEGFVYCIGFETELDPTILPNCLFFDEDGILQKTLDAMVQEVKAEQPYFVERVNVLMRDVLLQTMRKCAPKKKKSDDKMDMIINYIDAYFTTEIDFKMLANSLNYSYDYLRHYFKAHKQTSLKQYVIWRRLSLAKKLLVYNTPIADVARRCGFDSPAYFSAVFRQSTGMTPSQYRDTHSRVAGQNETIMCDAPDKLTPP